MYRVMDPTLLLILVEVVAGEEKLPNHREVMRCLISSHSFPLFTASLVHQSMTLHDLVCW